MIGDNIIDLGCVGHCDIVNTDICIENAGTYYLEYDLDGVKRYVEITTGADAENLVFPAKEFPVNREIMMRVLDSDQKVLGDGEFNKIRFKTIIKLINE